MRVAVRAAAESDLEAAFDFYETERRGLGTEFLLEFRRAVDRMVNHPRAWQALGEGYRRCRLHRFPYGVIYKLDGAAGEIIVVAVHHLHRRPGAWRKRPDP